MQRSAERAFQERAIIKAKVTREGGVFGAGSSREGSLAEAGGKGKRRGLSIHRTEGPHRACM